MNTIKCSTLFDITATGVTGHYKSARAPFLTETEWQKARNQQRNWETLQQIISLRTQIMNLTTPVQSNNSWSFEFESETPAVYGDSEDPVRILKQDAKDVPMICELDNQSDLPPFLVVDGARQNIWFTVIDINNELGN